MKNLILAALLVSVVSSGIATDKWSSVVVSGIVVVAK